MPFRKLIYKLQGYSKKSRFLADASIYVSGNFLQKATSFLLIPIWAQFLNPEDYGITGTLIAYSGVLSTLLGLGLQGAVVRHYYDYTDDEHSQKQYITSVTLFQIVVAGVVVVGLTLWGEVFWIRFTTNTIAFRPYVQLALWTVYADLLALIPVSLYQARQKAREFVFVQYGRFLLTTICNIFLVVFLRLNAYGVLLGSLLASIFTSIIVLILAYRQWFTLSVSWTHVHKALIFGLPLVPHAIAAWALKSVDRVVLERYVSLNEMGLYNFGYTLGLVMQYLVTGINQAWAPYYYQMMKQNQAVSSKIIRVVSVYIALVGTFCLLGILFTAEVVSLLLPDQYHGSIQYVAPVLLGSLMLGLYYFAGMPLFYLKKTHWLPMFTLVSSMVNLILNILYVPRFGASASAWITLVGYTSLFIMVYFAGQHYHKTPYPILRYSICIAVIWMGALQVSHWGIFDIRGLVYKFLILSIYIFLAYLLLLRQPRTSCYPDRKNTRTAQ